jgi:xylan 1,4-beta-xylosidase
VIRHSILGLTALLVPSGAQAQVVFEYMSYQGRDPVEDAMPAGSGDYRNPIIPGFHPDPSIVRVGKDYYLVSSSFGWFPGLPVYHSQDLVNWQQIGNAIDRQDVFDIKSVGINRGIFAPTIRWHKGLFYIISTCIDCGFNFIITTRNPKGPWSDPIWLKEIDGIDPDIFFDDDGRVWISNNRPPEGTPEYDGHRALWIQEYDLSARRVIARARSSSTRVSIRRPSRSGAKGHISSRKMAGITSSRRRVARPVTIRRQYSAASQQPVHMWRDRTTRS